MKLLIFWFVLSVLVEIVVCKVFDYSVLKENRNSSSLESWFQQLNDQYKNLNHYSAFYTWEINVNSRKDLLEEAAELGSIQSNWKQRKCNEAAVMLNQISNNTHKRMIFLLCRGPKYTDTKARELSILLDQIYEAYTETKVCLPTDLNLCSASHQIWENTFVKSPDGKVTHLNLSAFSPNQLSVPNISQVDRKSVEEPLQCFGVEPELEELMKTHFRIFDKTECRLPSELILRWTWESWRAAVSPEIAPNYFEAIKIMNEGARNNGYQDIGESWREELEMENLQFITAQLWKDVRPFYELLHGVLRYALIKKHAGDGRFSKNGPLPAHLMGSMWSSDWSIFNELLMPFQKINLDGNLAAKNWTSFDMVKRAEDFYTSLGLNPMTKVFWQNSKFNKTDNNTKCHGSAGDMFDNDDYRMIVCAKQSFDGFYEIVHEMGHIQYYMHSNNQPAIFHDSTNSAFGESIGDMIYLAMMTPQHLNRLSLIPDEALRPTPHSSTTAFQNTRTHYNLVNASNDNESMENTFMETLERFMPIADKFEHLDVNVPNHFDLSLLLKMALSKIPQIPFEYLIDKFRWDLFAGKFPFSESNQHFWELILNEQGIHPPEWENRQDLFDFTGKFHIADNTPYVRYFLSSFLQVQIFKGLCEYTVFGRFHSGKKLPMPLHRCDIYGSRRAGNLLKKALNLGSSAHWTEVLSILTGTRQISSEPLVEYYKPLQLWLTKIVLQLDIPLGWQYSHEMINLPLLPIQALYEII